MAASCVLQIAYIAHLLAQTPEGIGLMMSNCPCSNFGRGWPLPGQGSVGSKNPPTLIMISAEEPSDKVRYHLSQNQRPAGSA